MFTQEQWNEINKIPPSQIENLISDMVGSAKREIFKFIEAKTGTMPAHDYMLTHKHEFEAKWASGEDHSIASVWSWRGVPAVKQRGTIVFDGENIKASLTTEAYR